MTKLEGQERSEGTVQDRVVRLVSAHALHEGVLLDLGCGLRSSAPRCAELGLEYLGVHAVPDDLEELARKGLDTALVELGDTTTLAERLEEALAGRQLAAITALDLDRAPGPPGRAAHGAFRPGEQARRCAPCRERRQRLALRSRRQAPFGALGRHLGWSPGRAPPLAASRPAGSRPSSLAPAGRRSRRTTRWPAVATSTSPRP